MISLDKSINLEICREPGFSINILEKLFFNNFLVASKSKFIGKVTITKSDESNFSILLL